MRTDIFFLLISDLYIKTIQNVRNKSKIEQETAQNLMDAGINNNIIWTVLLWYEVYERTGKCGLKNNLVK